MMPQEVTAAKETALTPETEVVSAQQMAFDLIKSGAPVESIKEFMTLSRELAADEARRAFDLAVSEAKAEIPVITKNKHVGFVSRKEGAAKTDYWHEDFAQVARTVDPILSKYGLSYRYEAAQEGAMLSVTCVLSHRLGHSTRTTLTAGNDTTGNKNSIQGVGSTATFLQRYTLKLSLGLSAAKDDDAKAGGGEEYLTDEQVDQLKKAIDDAAFDVDGPEADYASWLSAFLVYMKVETLADLPAESFDKAKAAIANSKVTRKAAKK